MNFPFVVWSLPRSRTAWLQTYLGGPSLVGHDLALETTSPQAWLDSLWHGRTGTVETGMTELWPLSARAMPGGPIATIRRPIGEVVQSLATLGVTGMEKELERRDSCLDAAEAAGALSIQFSDLSDPSCCAFLFEHLTGLRFSFDWWQVMSVQNIQIDVAKSLARQQTNTESVSRMCGNIARDLATPRTYLRVGREPWASFWADAESRLPADHLATHGPDATALRPFSTDPKFWQGLESEGKLLVTTARRDGTLVGYLLWLFGPAPQTNTTVVAGQGPMYVDPGQFGVAGKLFKFGLEAFRRLGVKSFELQHNAFGRSAGLSRYFLRLGARPHLSTFSLDLP